MVWLTDRLLFPCFLLWILGSTCAFLRLNVPASLVAACVIAPAVIAVAILERLRPERDDYRAPDQPLRVEAGHFLVGVEAGSILAYGAAVVLASACASLLTARFGGSLWPSRWPIAAQVALAALLGECLGYWQHRLGHRLRALWRFHALHHSGARLNVVRAGRFHFVDIAAGTFLTYAPLALLGAPPSVFAWLASMAGTLGVLQHANIRMRTPAWLDAAVCTPAVHRLHHSRDRRESDGNFGTFVMLFDHLFGSYVPPVAPGPAACGIEDDPVPRGFWAQVVAPFGVTRSRNAGSTVSDAN